MNVQVVNQLSQAEALLNADGGRVGPVALLNNFVHCLYREGELKELLGGKVAHAGYLIISGTDKHVPG